MEDSTTVDDHKRSTSTIRSSGFYFKNKWISINRPSLVPNRHNLIQCLNNKTVYFLGDSTLRQWFVYIIEQIEQIKLQKHMFQVLRFAIGMVNWNNAPYKIAMKYHHHGFPSVAKWVSTKDIHYIANMIDSLPYDRPRTVYFLSIWAHFTATDLNFYRGRLSSIKRALDRLHRRNPSAVVIVKGANTREGHAAYNNWYQDHLNSVLIEEFIGLPNVFIIDAWSMTLGHYSGWNIHPVDLVVNNQLAVALPYICPDLV